MSDVKWFGTRDEIIFLYHLHISIISLIQRKLYKKFSLLQIKRSASRYVFLHGTSLITSDRLIITSKRIRKIDRFCLSISQYARYKMHYASLHKLRAEITNYILLLVFSTVSTWTKGTLLYILWHNDEYQFLIDRESFKKMFNGGVVLLFYYFLFFECEE